MTKAEGTGYDILIGSGLLDELGGYVSALSCLSEAVSCAVIYDSNCVSFAEAAADSLRSAGYEVFLKAITADENKKNLDTFSDICLFLASCGIRRTDFIVSVGGGITGDTVGFAAACYMRGISYIQIPTTILSQNDSSVGGKTGVNLPQGKNLAGAFHRPLLVVCDTDTLSTLPERERKSGIAEVIKHGAILSEELFLSLEYSDFMNDAERLTALSVSVKTGIVRRDEFEQSERKLLNFGHTFGHALEQCSAHRYSHGEAVALGMLAAARAGEVLGVTLPGTAARLEALLIKYSLPVKHSIPSKQLTAAMRSDKKLHGGTLDLILLRSIGEAIIYPVQLGQLESIVSAGLCSQYAVCSGGTVSGTAQVPPSKSELQRAIICAALSDGSSTVGPYEPCGDVDFCIKAVRSLGANVITESNGFLRVTGIRTPPQSCVIECGGSATLLRLMIPVCAALGVNTHFSCSAQLLNRPLDEYFRLLPEHGVHILRRNGGVEIYGKMTGGSFTVSTEISSQYLSGLMLALPLCSGGGELVPCGEACSAPYTEVTAQVQRCFCVEVPAHGGIITQQQYHPADHNAEGDWSQAAVLLAAGAISGSITVNGICRDSAQGDSAICGLLSQMGADVCVSENSVTVSHRELHGIETDVSAVPDLVPVLAVLGCAAEGLTVLHGTSRLKFKESDRAAGLAAQLSSIGADIDCRNNCIIINGSGRIDGGFACGCGDHRVVMALALAGLISRNPVRAADPLSVSKSWPDFFNIFNSIGGCTDVVNMGK